MIVLRLAVGRDALAKIDERRCIRLGVLRLAVAVLLSIGSADGSRLTAQQPAQFQASSAETVFEHLDEKNGLASPIVTSFAQDGDGFLWVGTQSGLQRWDGYQFWSYKTQLGSSTSIPDNLINTLYTDSQGRLWVGTSSGGLARYDRATDNFTQYRSSGNDISAVNVYAITGDGGRGLWIGTDTGLYHLDADTGRFAHPTLGVNDEREPARRVLSLLHTAQGELWVGTELGLERSVITDPQRSDFQRVPVPVPPDASSEINSLFEDTAGNIWIGTQHGAYVVERQARGAGEGAHTAPGRSSSGDKLTNERITTIAGTAEGEIWFGTQEHGILALKPGDPNASASWPLRSMGHDMAQPTSLSNNWVRTLYPGTAGIVWVGTQRGVSYVDTSQRGIINFLGGTEPGRLITSTDVYSVLARRDGSVWVGLSANGIDILDSSGRRTGGLRPKPGHSKQSLSRGTVGCLFEDSAGSVYICSQQGLYRASGTTGTPRLEEVPIGNEASANLIQVYEDRGTLWIAGSDGLWMFDLRDASGPAKRVDLQQPFTDRRMQVMSPGPGHTLWIGTEYGLNLFDLESHAVERILPNPSNPEGLGAGMISTLLTDRKGRLWVGTFTGGIDVMEGRDRHGRPRFHRIIDGLPNQNIDKLLEAADGKIWASTDGGFAEVDPDTFEVHVLKRADGVLFPAYWNNVGAKTESGELLFGGTGGLTVVRPSLVKRWKYEPPVLVTHARIGSYDVPISRFNSGLKEYPVWIPPDHNDLTLEFAALDYTAPERNQYAYKLEGFDRDWIAADPTRRLARYTNLPPGNYVLLLKGSNRDGVWAPLRRIRIHVIPAWYQTWWFRLLVVILSALALAALFLLATAYLRRQQRELERQVALRTLELELRTVELKESQQLLEQMAYTDSLTGLPNRRMFTEQFKRLLALKRRQEGTFALLLMDFDHFKHINDTHGHDAGDAVLKEMAQRLMSQVRESDCLARLGGDEFGLLLSESPDLDATESVCRKVVASFEEPVAFEGLLLKTSPSIGVAIFPQGGITQDELYKKADLALYQAKRDGGNGWSLQPEILAQTAGASIFRSSI